MRLVSFVVICIIRVNLRLLRSHFISQPRYVFVNSSFTLLVFACAALAATPSQTQYKVIVQNDVKVKMRDGITLVADIYRPQSETPFPVLVERTPYNRQDEASMAVELASHGYVVVLQDTRGRYDSEGEFYPFRDESKDGYDTIEWAAQLPGVNGKVGMFGGSYVGATQMLAAMAGPPHLKAILPFVTGSEYYEGWTYQSGVFNYSPRSLEDSYQGNRFPLSADEI